MTTVGAQGRCKGNGVTKESGNSRKHLIQMFHCRMEECSSAAKWSTNNQYVCKYIGRINDQSNWSGPFSLVVMTLDYRSRGTWFDPRSRHSTGIFSLHVYFFSYYICNGPEPFEQLWTKTIQGSFLWSVIKIQSVVQEEMSLKEIVYRQTHTCMHTRRMMDKIWAQKLTLSLHDHSV